MVEIEVEVVEVVVGIFAIFEEEVGVVAVCVEGHSSHP